jgi:hypothetical protein
MMGHSSKEYMQKWRAEHIEQVRATARKTHKKWYYAHPGKQAEHSKKWMENNPQKVYETRRRYYESNKEKMLEANKCWAQQNPEKVKAKSKRWRSKNREYLNSWYNSYRERHPEQVIMRNIVINMMKDSRSYKKSKCREYVGCSREFLRNHLESQFRPGMTWDNYGDAWVVDHIVPVSWFPFDKDPSLFYVASHYSNLQPLFVKENLAKSNKHCERMCG